MDDAILRLERVEVRYGSFIAVHSLDLALHPGELFGLLGPNGAGKSSTMRVLIGQSRPTSGRVLVAGLDVVRDWQRVKPLFGYVPDRENHFEELTGWANLNFFADLYGVTRTRVRDCLAMVELAESAHLPTHSFSLGMRRKLLLARALLHQPRLLYLDEPTANLDIHSRDVVHRILRGLVRNGTTVLMTSHDMKEVEEVCDRVAILCKGKLVALDSPMALRARHAERMVDVELTSGERLAIDLDDSDQRTDLGDRVAAGTVASLRTREFDFHEAFLKLTGSEFN